MQVESFYDQATFTLSYIVYDKQSKDAVIIDPVLDINTRSWSLTTSSVDKLEHFINQQGLTIHWILDTHVHADHITGMQELKDRFGAKLAISSAITVVQQTFNQIFNSAAYVAEDGSQFDRLLNDGDSLTAGSLTVEVISTPGHTPACITYKIGQGIFTGDALFLPDIGVARCDFPKGSAEDLYHSITQKLYTLPNETRVYVGHDYPPDDREVCDHTSIGESKKKNIDLPEGLSKQDFITYINHRDKTLAAPRLLYESVQLNINAGLPPKAESNGKSYLKMPLNF